ncbi:MAG: hypothetical protein ACTJHC_09435 [Vagococcus sp.]
MADNQAQECTSVGGWSIPNNELDRYVEERNDMIDYLTQTLRILYDHVELGGEHSEDGEYIFAQNGKNADVLIHFDPVEVEAFHSFQDKMDYLNMKWFVCHLEGSFFDDDTKGVEENVDAWYQFVASEYEKKMNRKYPLPY